MSPEGEESLAGKEQFSCVAYLLYFKWFNLATF